nr:Flp pilus assembly protein CpaB [uncultured Rhodopila sp.]
MPLRIFLAGLLLFTTLGLGLVGYQATRPPPATKAAAPQPPPPLTIAVLAAARSLPAGTLLKDDDFTQRDMLAAEVPPAAVTSGQQVSGGVHGALLRRYLDAGATLVAGDILHPRDRGFLAAVLTPGTRAISVGVDAITGNGGLIWPGDRVDLLLTQELNEKIAPLARRIVAETVLTDVRVVAVDLNVTQGAVVSIDNAAGHLARTVTLEVTPQQAERAVVAERLGKVSLAIRSVEPQAAASANGEPPQAAASANGEPPSVYGGDVSAALADGGIAGPPRMRVIQGSDSHDVTFQ